MDEFDIMREQLAAIKRDLDRQQIINAELMRNVMRGKASWLNKFVVAEVIILPFIYLFFALLCKALEISQWYASFYLVMGIVDLYFDWRTVRIPARLFSTCSVLELKKFLLRQKRERFVQTCVATPIVVVWLVMLSVQMIGKTAEFGPGEIAYANGIAGLAGGIVGTLIGIIAVILIYRKMQHTNDELLRDINNLESAENEV